ncbi:MAG: (2Fe-2S) ferredoxin domain-containing protein [Bacteroidota bacterium]|jgi:NADH:ubiquinone oxidoreductase subunit E
MNNSKVEIAICLGSSCFSRGNKEVLMRINQYLKMNKLEDQVNFHGKHCMGICAEGPVLEIDGVMHKHVTPEDITFILSSVLKKD